MAATFGGGGGSSGLLSYQYVVDENASQDSGAAVEGIGLTGTDAAAIGGSRLGSGPTDDFVFADPA